MKAFEKWFMKEASTMGKWNYDEKDAAEIGWRAALEWSENLHFQAEEAINRELRDLEDE